jgi:hypothetical protein
MKDFAAVARHLIAPADVRPHLLLSQINRGSRTQRIKQFDLTGGVPQQIIVISRVTLSNYHYLIPEHEVSLSAVGEWDRSMRTNIPDASIPEALFSQAA